MSSNSWTEYALLEICERFFDELGDWIVFRRSYDDAEGFCGDELLNDALTVSDMVEDLIVNAHEIESDWEAMNRGY